MTERRPQDMNQLGKLMIDIATGQVEDNPNSLNDVAVKAQSTSGGDRMRPDRTRRSGNHGRRVGRIA